jgi:predicted amidohydrolase YtcJ
MKSVLRIILGSGLLFLAACQAPEAKQAADLIITNATIYTVDSNFTVAQAMAIKNGKILAVGSTADIKAAYKSDSLLNGKGQFIYPGLNDAHCHFVGYAEGLLKVNLVGTQSWQEVLERTQKFAVSKDLSFIEGRGWDQNDWAVKEFPTKKELDSLFPETPVVLKRIDGHAALANQAAFNFAKISGIPQVQGGLVAAINGQATGLLIDNAVALIKFPALPRQQKIATLLQAQKNLHAVGLTSLTEAGLLADDILLIDSLQKAGLLKLRINAMVSDDSASLAYFLENEAIENDWLRVKSAKFYLDGALGSRGALLLEPYSDDASNHGLQLMTTPYFKKWAQKIAAAQWQMCVHTIGDSANRLAISVFEEALGQQENRRWRLEHAQIMSPADVKRLAQTSIIPSTQPTHATSDMYWAKERLGAERLKRAYRAKQFLENGAALPLGTDFPVEDINPMFTFRAAVFRQDAQGFPDTAFFAKQRLSPQEALKGMTYFGAYASFEENKKGRLVPGQIADFVIYNQDFLSAPLSELNTVRPLQTYVDGQLVFDAAR